jgi:hypothetical protein
MPPNWIKWLWHRIEGNVLSAIVFSIAGVLVTYFLYVTHGLTRWQQTQIVIIFALLAFYNGFVTWKSWRANSRKASQPTATEVTPPVDVSGRLAALAILKRMCSDLLKSYRDLDATDKRVSRFPTSSTNSWPRLSEPNGWDYIAHTLWRNYVCLLKLAAYQKTVWLVLGWADSTDLREFREVVSVTVTMPELLARLEKFERIIEKKISESENHAVALTAQKAQSDWETGHQRKEKLEDEITSIQAQLPNTVACAIIMANPMHDGHIRIAGLMERIKRKRQEIADIEKGNG